MSDIYRFDSEREAFAWMYDFVDDSCIDNGRFAWADDPKEVEKYHKQADNGCCGFFDTEVVIKGRKALIGCNYGH
jgi:hypothetical protein